MYSQKTSHKPSMIAATTSPKRTKPVSKTEFEAQNLQQQLKLNDMRHKELMKQTLLRKKRKERKLEEEKRQKEQQQKLALEAIREEQKEQYNKFLKQATVRNRSANTSKLQSVVSPDGRPFDGYPVNQKYSRRTHKAEAKASENSFEELEKQVNVRVYEQEYNNHYRGNRDAHREHSRDSAEDELDEILERDLREKKLREEQEKANAQLSPIHNPTYNPHQQQGQYKPSIENLLEDKTDYNKDQGRYSYKQSKESTQFTLNSKLTSNTSDNDNTKFKRRFAGTNEKGQQPDSSYVPEERRIKDSTKQRDSHLPSNARTDQNTRRESDILASINKLDDLLKSKRKKLQEIKKRPKSMFSMPEQTNGSKFSINTNKARKPHAYHSDVKEQKDILTGFRTCAKPQFNANPYSQFNYPIGQMHNYGGYGMPPPPYQQMPISAITAPVHKREDEYMDFDTEEPVIDKQEPAGGEKNFIKDMDEIGNLDKENHNATNNKRLRPISVINETNSYSVLTDMVPPRNDLNGLYADKSYFQRRNMQKNLMNRRRPGAKDEYEDGYELKEGGDGRIQYHPHKIKELFDE